jgi:hypothetical protein
MWGRDSKPHDHFQMTMPLTRQTRRVLLLLDPEEERVVLPTFESADSLGRISVPIGGHHARVTALFDARFYRGPRGSR